ncbi:Sulfatase-like protein [Globisporangium polare]
MLTPTAFQFPLLAMLCSTALTVALGENSTDLTITTNSSDTSGIDSALETADAAHERWIPPNAKQRCLFMTPATGTSSSTHARGTATTAAGTSSSCATTGPS